jgi:hypothetical protein
LLSGNSAYNVKTPGMTLAARGTAFAVRVEADGRSAMLVSEGLVAAADGEAEASVPTGFGVRAPVDGTLSEVVAATDFGQLDAALDGCGVTVTTPDDVSLNVRTGPSRDSALIGTIFAEDIAVFYGVSASGGWYRIMFGEGFGWVLTRTATLAGGCVRLREFPDDFQEGDSIEPVVDLTPQATETPAP